MSASDLDGAAITRSLLLHDPAWSAPVHVVPTTRSTNDDARRAAAAGEVAGAAFLADAQSGGRGRGGHVWHSPPGENLYLTVVLRPRIAATALSPVTLALGVAVARVVEDAIARRDAVAIKWPNDVLVDGRKVAGVLVEGQLRGDRVQSLVAGVGLNVHARSFPPPLDDRATSLILAGATRLDRSALAAALIAGFVTASARFEAEGLAAFLADLERRDALAGRRVRVGGLVGLAVGVDVSGALRLRDDHGCVHAVVAGEAVALEESSAPG